MRLVDEHQGRLVFGLEDLGMGRREEGEAEDSYGKELSFHIDLIFIAKVSKYMQKSLLKAIQIENLLFLLNMLYELNQNSVALLGFCGYNHQNIIIFGEYNH